MARAGRKKNSNPLVELIIDDRRIKDDGTAPMKIRIYHNNNYKYFPIVNTLSSTSDVPDSLTIETYRRLYKPKPNERLNDIERVSKIKLDEITKKAKRIVNDLNPYSHNDFKVKFNRRTGDGGNVFWYYQQTIEKLKGEGRIKTALNYESSFNSIKEFCTNKGFGVKKQQERLLFEQVTVQFLNSYEKMASSIKGKKYSQATIGFYLRPLRAIFNDAITNQDISYDIYPFNRMGEDHKYQIPVGDNKKKSLSKYDLNILISYPLAEDSVMFKAREYFFFSYNAQGMNFKDIAMLKWHNIMEKEFWFIRSKTKYTRKRETKITVVINEYIRSVLKKHFVVNDKPDAFVFPILSHEMNPTQQQSAVDNFVKFGNQHMKKLAKLVGITTDVSTYFARHSYTTISINNGDSPLQVQENLGHADPKTFMSYFKGFTTDKKTKSANELMNFDEE